MGATDGEPVGEITQRREAVVQSRPTESGGLVNDLVGGLVGGVVNDLVGGLVGGVVGIKTQPPTGHEPGQVSGVAVQLAPEGYQVLKALAAARGKSVSEALGDALRLATLVHKLGEENGRLLVERDGRIQEVLLL
jgi:hypothetical protein